MTGLTRLIILSFSLFAQLAFGGEVCKWVDDEGVTHFSEYCSENEEATVVAIDESLPTEHISSGESRSQQLHNKVVVRRESEALEEKEKERERRKQAREESFRNYNCAHAGHMIKTLTRARPIFFDDHGNLQYDRSTYARAYEGGRRFVDEEERAQLIEQWNKVQLGNCDMPDQTG